MDGPIATAIFSCFRSALRDYANDGIDNASGIDQVHFDAGDDWGYFGEVRAQVDGVFFGGDEGFGVGFFFQAKEVPNVGWRVPVMVAVELFGNRVNTCI
jgi:hypothetical protein